MNRFYSTLSWLLRGVLVWILAGAALSGAAQAQGDTSPTIAVTSSADKVVIGQSATITFTLDQASSDFVQSDVTLLASDGTTGGTLSNWQGSGQSYSVVFTPKADFEGSVDVSVASGAFTNAGGLANADGGDVNNSVTINVDTIAPTLDETDQDIPFPTLVSKGVIFALPIFWTETVHDFDPANVVITNATVLGFAEDNPGSRWRIALRANDNGDPIQVSIPANAAYDAPSSEPRNAIAAINKTILVDAIVADLVEITPVDSPTRDTTPTVIVQASEPVTLTYSGTCSGDLSSISSANVDTALTLSLASGAEFTDGTYTCQIRFNDALSPAGDPDSLFLTPFTIDTTPATLVSVTPSKSNFAEGDTLTLSVKFSEEMDTASTPTLSFSPDVSASLVTAISSGWSSSSDADNDTYTIEYTVGSVAQNQTDIDVIVGAGLADAAGNVTVEQTDDAVFNLFTAAAADPEITVSNASGTELTTNGTDSIGDFISGLPQSTTYTIENEGALPLTISSFASSSLDNVSDMVLSQTGPVTLQGGQSMTLTVTFTPVNAGDFGFDISIAHNDADDNENPFVIMANGTAADDVTPPTLAISSDRSQLAIGQTALLTFTLSEDSEDFDQNSITYSNGSLSNFTGSGTTYTAEFTPSSNTEADAEIKVLASVFTDLSNNDNLASDPLVINVDTIRPTVSISDVPLRTNGGPFTATFTWSETVTDFTDASIVVPNGQVSDFREVQAGRVYTALISPDGTDNVRIHIWDLGSYWTSASKAAAYDLAGNSNPYTSALAQLVTDQFPEIEVSSSISGALTDGDTDDQSSPALNADTTVTYTVSSADASSTVALAVSSISVTNANNLNGTPVISEPYFLVAGGRSQTFDVTYNPSAVDFSFDLVINNNDADENPFTIKVTDTSVDDVTPPQVVALTPNPAIVGPTGEFELAVTFSETMNTTTAADLVFDTDVSDILIAQGAGQWSTTSATNDTYTVTYDIADQRMNIADIGVSFDATFEDAFGNALINAYSQTAVFDIVQDDIPPTIALSTDKTALSSGETATITFTMSEPVTGFELSDVAVSGGSLSEFQGDGALYSALFTPDHGSTTDGDVSVASNAFIDLLGNANQDGDDADNALTIAIDTLLPGLTEVTAIPTPHNDATPDYTFAATSPGDITYGGPCTSADDTTATTGDNTVTFDTLSDGTYETCTLTVTDSFGNTSAALSVSAFTVDTVAPTVLSISTEPDAANDVIIATITFSEPVTGFDSDGDFTLTNGTATPPSEAEPNDGTTFTLTLTPDANVVSAMELQIIAGAATDAAGNQNVASDVTAISADILAPTVTLSADQTELGMDETALIRFTLSEASTTFALEDVTVSGGTLSEFAGSGSLYTALFTPAFGQVTEAGTGMLYVAADGFEDASGNANLASDILEIDFSGAIIERTSHIINNFIARRADQITASEPDLSTRLNRARASAETAGNWSGGGDGRSQNQMSFTTSLAQIRAWQQRDKRAPNMEDGEALPFGARPFAQTHGDVPADIWLSGSVSRIDNEFTTSALGLLHGGIDYALNEALVLGLMGQLDWVDEENDAEAYSASGLGWMAGPYIVAELKDDLVVDARIAWGQSDNDVSPFDTYEDEFETERLLVSGKLTGGVHLSKASLRPQLGLIYFEETQLGYDDSNGLYVPSQEISLGRLTFSPNLSQSWDLEDGSTFAMNWNLKGIWDFDTADLTDVDTGLQARSDAELRARAEAGFNLNLVNGMRVQTSGFFDGIGVRDYRAYGGTVTVTIPLDW